jgi:hypothetical protein
MKICGHITMSGRNCTLPKGHKEELHYSEGEPFRPCPKRCPKCRPMKPAKKVTQ